MKYYFLSEDDQGHYDYLVIDENEAMYHVTISDMEDCAHQQAILINEGVFFDILDAQRVNKINSLIQALKG